MTDRGNPAPKTQGPTLVERRVQRIANARSVTIGLALTFVLLALLGAVVMRIVDQHNFPSLGWAVWWALQTVTTVGYGDVVPSSGTGRVIGAFVMISGIAFLTVIIAAVTASLIEAARRCQPTPPDREQLPEFMREVTARLSAIEARLDELRPRASVRTTSRGASAST